MSEGDCCPVLSPDNLAAVRSSLPPKKLFRLTFRSTFPGEYSIPHSRALSIPTSESGANGDGGMRSPSSSRGNGWTISLCLSRDHTPVLALPADGRFVKILTSRAHLDVSAGVCVPIRGDAGHHLVRFWAVAAVVRGEALGANGSSGVVSPISAAGVARFFSIWASSQVLTAAAARSRPTSS